MARGFGSVGVDLNDVITVTALIPDVMSIFVWVTHISAGGSDFGRVFDGSNLATSGMNCFTNVGGNYFFNAYFSGTAGSWNTDTLMGSGEWQSLGVTYDASSDANTPTIFDRGNKKTVGSGITVSSAPTGTHIPASTSTLLGNRVGGARNWDGMLAEFAMWNAQLSDGEFMAMHRGCSPLLIRPQSLTEYLPMVRENVSFKRAAPTITGTAVQPHARIIQPKRWQGPSREAGPPPPVISETLFAQACL